MSPINISLPMQVLDTKSQFQVNIAISGENLLCTRDERLIFTGLNFNLTNGQALFLRGPNGAGKSTLLLALAGLLPHEGKLSFGRTIQQEDQLPTSQLIHFISLTSAMKAQLTLAENLAFWCKMLGGSESKIPQALKDSGLGGLDNFETGHLSTGQTHRLSLARLLVSPRPIWLLDEPSSALDADGDTWVASLIDDHIAKGGLVIAATHRPISLKDAKSAKTLNLGART